MHNVFDAHTNRQLFDMIGQGLFEGLESPISIGKEANVFSARKSDGSLVIVKIYRITTADFKRMYEYIRTDPRFEGLHNSKRKVLFAWVQREYHNLHLARKAGIRVPTPLGAASNVLVLEYIGNKEGVAPKLKDTTPEHPMVFLDALIDELRKLYEAGYVHADMSPYNILNFEDQPVLIDFSQVTPKSDPHAEEFLSKGITNIVLFFKKCGLKPDADAIWKTITGKSRTR